MLDVDTALDRLTTALAYARRLGADAADAVYVGDGSTSIDVRLGALEDIGRSEGEEIGLRLFVGQRSASVSTSDLSAAALELAAERAIAMAREAPEDPYAGLADPALLTRATAPDLDLFDSAEPDAATLRERALAAEDAARGVAGVSNSQGASASTGTATVALATSHGFAGGYATSSHSLSASVIAGEGSGMQRDYAWHSARHMADLDTPEAVGLRAGARAVARLNPVKLDTAQMPILFDPRVGSGLLGHLVGAITGSAIARRTSFLLDALETAVFGADVTIIDNPLQRRGPRSRPFDGEGLATAATTIIDKGVLTGWLMDSASARQLGLMPTGHAARGTAGPPGASVTNLHLANGTTSREAMLGSVKRGFYVTELIGHGVNPVTGDYSRGAAGFLIEDGVIGAAVAEVTIAGNLKDMFREMTPADDLVFRHSMNVPTLRIDGMTVAGA